MRPMTKQPRTYGPWEYRVCNDGNAVIECEGWSLTVTSSEDNDADTWESVEMPPDVAKRLVKLLNEFEWEAS